MKKKKSEVLDRRSTLDDAKKEEMLAVLIRNQQAYDSVVDQFQVKHAQSISDAHALVWEVARDLAEQLEGKLPKRGSILAEINNRMKANPELVGEEEANVINTFLEYAYDDEEHGANLAKSSAHCTLAIATVSQLLQEFIATETRDLLDDGTIVIDSVSFLEQKKTELEIVRSLNSIDLGLPFPPGWEQRENVKLFNTGVPALDTFMGGGWRAPEVVLFLGPYGSCKTTLVCHGVAEMVYEAAEEYTLALHKWKFKKKKKPKAKPPKRPVVVLIFTEGDKDTYRVRLMSHMATVPWKKLAQMASLESLCGGTKPGMVKDTTTKIGTIYEKTEFPSAKAGKHWQNERMRVTQGATLFNKHLVLIDCTDSVDSPYKIGKGGIPELSNIIRAHFRKNPDTKPIAFWLDHVSALADRMAESTDSDTDEKLHLVLKRMPRQAADRITKVWSAPMMLMHQFTGQINKKHSPGIRVSHADAGGSASIGEYVDFAFVTGPPNESNLCVFRCTKHRREPPTATIIVEIRGEFNRLVDRSADYVLSQQGRIVPRGENYDHFQAVANLNQHIYFAGKNSNVMDD